MSTVTRNGILVITQLLLTMGCCKLYLTHEQRGPLHTRNTSGRPLSEYLNFVINVAYQASILIILFGLGNTHQ